jgi:type IV secretion system protein VirB9
VVTYEKNLPNMLFVKPTRLGSNSNLTVVTTRHSYYFHVASNTQLNSPEKATYAIKFFYPEDARQQLKASLEAQRRHRAATLNANKHPKTYNWNYSFNGSSDIMPLHVFDDGVFTYFEMRPNQPMPAIFIVDNKQGEEAVVNMRRQGDLLIVQRTAPQFTLRMGKSQVASIFNNVEISRIKGGRR